MISVTKVDSEEVIKLEKEYFLFTSFDLITGKLKSNLDIAYNLVNNLTWIDYRNEEYDLKDVNRNLHY